MSDRDRFDDRHLPADLFRASLSGKITADEARNLARRRWESDERRGGSMNDLLRAALAGTSPDGRARRAQAARDERGRFAKGEQATPSMNDLIREQLGKPAAGGTMDLSHLMGTPPEDEAA
jgi:hypothetical protein